GQVSGVVTAPDGGVVAGAWVSALAGGDLDAEGARLVNQAKSDDEGRYTLTLRPGTYHLLAHREGAGREPALPVEITAGGASTQDLALGAEGRLVVSTSFVGALGEDLGALPAKLSVLPLDDTQRASAVLDEYRR